MIWKFITFFVRKLDPEIAHKITIKFLKFGLHPRLNKIGIPINIGNLNFKNFIGVAAGFDKNAEVINKIHFLNFGFTNTSWTVIDSPATTSQITYDVQMICGSGSTIYINRNVYNDNRFYDPAGISFLTLMEVSG